jgi:hypothetical protein
MLVDVEAPFARNELKLSDDLENKLCCSERRFETAVECAIGIGGKEIVEAEGRGG